jgi:hypothetical protein
MNLDDQTFAAEAQPNHRLQDIAETCEPLEMNKLLSNLYGY